MVIICEEYGMDCSLSGPFLALFPREISNNDIIGGKRMVGMDWIEVVVDQINAKSGSHCRRANNHLSAPNTHLICVRTLWYFD